MGHDIDSKTKVDHINNNQLDCRRSNLREIKQGEVDRNKRKQEGSSSEYYGVCWDKKNGNVACTNYYER